MIPPVYHSLRRESIKNASSASTIGVQSVRPTWFEDIAVPKETTPQPDQGQPQPLHGLKLVIKEEVLLSRSLYCSHVLNTFFGPVLGAMMKQVCWHSRRSEAHRGLPEARPRTQNVMARGQSEAHGDSNL